MPWSIHIVACRLFGDNPLSEPMMVYGQSELKEYISMKNAFENVIRLQNGGHLVSASMC